MRRHNDFIPEAFTSDYQVHWGQHFLRPEFLESTYFLHRYTGCVAGVCRFFGTKFLESTYFLHRYKNKKLFFISILAQFIFYY